MGDRTPLSSARPRTAHTQFNAERMTSGSMTAHVAGAAHVAGTAHVARTAHVAGTAHICGTTQRAARVEQEAKAFAQPGPEAQAWLESERRLRRGLNDAH